MREIKFRAQDFTGTWQYGFLVKGNETAIIIPVNKNGSVAMGINFEVKPETVGQYTGLHDKNGKEIYEGDIVSWEYEDHDTDTGWRGIQKQICEVMFRYGSFVIGAYPYHLGSCEDFYADPETYGLEVIGNVYDNPELLGE